MKRNNFFISVLIAWIYLSGVAGATSVDRSVSWTTVGSGEEITVNLTVDITGNEDYYAIDELIPNGYSVKDSGGGSIGHIGHIKWLVISGATDTVYTYVITSPTIQGITQFTGHYIFQGDTTEKLIGGQNSLITQLTISGNTGVGGVTLVGLGVTSDDNGNYTATVSYGWSGTVTPTKTGYAFTPPSRTYSIVTSNHTSQNYTATSNTCAISGNTGVGGVTLVGLGVTSDGSGNYTATISYGWNGTVTPSKAGYTFTPPSRTYNNITDDQLNQNYTAQVAPVTISGNVGVDGVTMSGLPGDPITSGGGSYTSSVSSGWSGTVTPNKTGYMFTPPSKTYNSITNDQLNQNYTAQVIQTDYGMTITSCTINPNPANTNQTVTLSGTGGQVHAAANGAVIKVVIGFRDASGNWVGGEPVIISSTIPGTSFQPWTGSNAVIKAPSSAGTYYVWVHAVPTLDNATAIQDFKNSTPTTSDEAQNDKWTTALTVSVGYGMTIASCTINPNPANINQAVTLSGTVGQVHAAVNGAVIKVVIGFRDASGNWVGGDPVIISSTIPGTSFQPWTGSNAIINAPSTAGTYYVWVRAVPTVDNTIAIQDFKNNKPTTADEIQNDKYDTAVTVNQNQQTGSLNVTISPQEAIDAGAQWNVDGGAWHNSGDNVSDLTVGLHTVNYKPIPGWIAPESEQVTINNGQTTPIISPNYVQQTGNLLIKKCTITAGKYEINDSIKLSGTIDIASAEFSEANKFDVNIGGVYFEDINMSSFKAKNGKYTYTYRIPRYGQGRITSFVIDTNKHTFTLKAQKINLTALHCPFDIEFEIGSYWGNSTVDENIVNGKKFIPVQLMTGISDYLQVQSVKVKKGILTDTLTAKGGIALKNPLSPMSDVNLCNVGLVLTQEGQTFTIPAVNFKPSGKSGLKYVCKNAKISEGGIANGTIDFGKCTFSISIKNTKINSASGAVDLTLTMGSFNEQVNFDLDTGQTIY